MFKRSATVPFQLDTDFSPFKQCEFKEALEWLKANEFDGIEICIGKPQDVDAKKLVQALESYKLKVSTISTGQAKALEGISLTDEAEDGRQRAIQKVNEFIELACEMDFPLITIGLLRGGEAKCDVGRKMDMLKSSMAKCLEYAYKKSVRLMIEPINRYETKLINSTLDGLLFLEQMGNPEYLGILYDTFHSNIEDKEMPEAIKSAGNKIFHVHLADSNRWLPGEGHICFNRIIQALAGIHYKGYVSLETLNLPDRISVRDNAKASINRIYL